jgi:hypothetical protein
LVVVAKKKKRKSGAGWSWRLAGIALCAFFALGVVTGLSRAGRVFAVRLESLLNFIPHWGHSALIPANYWGAPLRLANIDLRPAAPAVALVERTDGFYTLAAQGQLRGPISPAWQGDLPILSGPGIENARTVQLLEWAGILVRAEADLSEVVSEMWAGADGRATLFLDRPRIEVTLDVDNSAVEIARAARVLTLWREHHDVIAALDMTTPGQAIVRFKPGVLENARRTTGIRKVATAATARSTPPPEVTASR